MSLIPRIDADGAALDAERQAAYDREFQRAGRVTNMKAVLLHALPSFRLFGDFLTVKEEVRKAIGDRSLSLFAHAISATAGCLVCSTYFRRLLLQEGIAPEDFSPSEDEALLIELGHAIGNPSEPPTPDLQERLARRYDAETLVNLVTYGGTMLATNVFNTVLNIDLDEYLEPFRLTSKPAA